MLGLTLLRRFRAGPNYAGCLPSLCGSGPRHDGATSAGVKVLCEVRSMEDPAATLAPAARRDGEFGDGEFGVGEFGVVPLSRGASASVNTS